jgi:hypothetical protein
MASTVLDGGYDCHAPAWPLHEKEPDSLRANVLPVSANFH